METNEEDLHILQQIRNKRNDLRMMEVNILDKHLSEGEGQWHRVGFWPCNQSPVGLCVYHKIEDRLRDSCIFCHAPHERK